MPRGKMPPAWEEYVRRIPIAYARRHSALGLQPERGVMPLLFPEGSDADTPDILGRYLGVTTRLECLNRDSIQRQISAAYEAGSEGADSALQSIEGQGDIHQIDEPSNYEDLLETRARAPVIQLVNLILFDAVKMKASDIHIQPEENDLEVRFRIDGVLFGMLTLPRSLQDEISSRVKIIAHMNIAEKRLAQDGRATVRVGERVIDLRISSVPVSHGERLVIRLLDKSARLYTLEELGMQSETLRDFRDFIGVEHGLILVTGPTGSGKSTTLYAALGEINSSERNIITLEDPIEYQLGGVSQIQVSLKKGMTFASGLRSVLRQDPDIIMVGEIRDKETAVLAIQSALTGHLVFSTLHTNDAASAATRLLDLGIEPYLISSSVIAIMAQRLVRRICPECSKEIEPRRESLESLGLEPRPDGARYLRGEGCARCRETGYSGRLGIFELLPMTGPIRSLVERRASASDISEDAVRRGMKTLRQEGLEKALRGETTLDEVLRVTLRKII